MRAVRALGGCSLRRILHHPCVQPLFIKSQWQHVPALGGFPEHQDCIQPGRCISEDIERLRGFFFGMLGCAGMFFGLVIMTRDRVEYVQKVSADNCI